jgi:hypothetical protein
MITEDKKWKHKNNKSFDFNNISITTWPAV